MGDAEGSEGGSEGLGAESCVVCFSQPPTQLQLVCGHVVLCADCCAVLQAQGDAQCPVCRGVLAECIDLADERISSWTTDVAEQYWPPENRLNTLLAFLRGALVVTHDKPGHQQCSCGLVSALRTSGFFAGHGPQQQQLALRGGVLDAIVALMRQKPLDCRVLFTASDAAAAITDIDDEIEDSVLRTAWESSGALKVFLHVLRLLKDCIPDSALSPLIASIHSAIKVLPFSALSGRDIVALSKLVSDVSARNDNPHVDNEQAVSVQDISLELLATLASRSVCTSRCIAEMLRAVRAADKSHSKTLYCAIASLHTAIVEGEPANAAVCCHAALAEDVDGVATLLNACTLLCDDGCNETLGLCAAWLLPTVGALCSSAPAALMRVVHLGGMTVFARLSEAAAEKKSEDLSVAVFELLGRLLSGTRTDSADAWRDARAAAATAAVSADLPVLFDALSRVSTSAAVSRVAGAEQAFAYCSTVAIPAVAGLLQHVELCWEGLKDLALFCQFGASTLACTLASMNSTSFKDVESESNDDLLMACGLLLDIGQRSPKPDAMFIGCCCELILVTLWDLASVVSEATQVAACRLLAHIVIRRGADAASLDLVSRAIGEHSDGPAMPLAALLTPCVVQRTKPALRAAAQQTLLLLLAIAVGAENAGTA